MTLREFEQLKLDFECHKFPSGTVDPVHLGIERGKVEKTKLERLINLGANVRSHTVKSRVERWKRQLARLESSITRLQQLKREIEASRLNVEISGDPSTPAPYRRMRVE